jgi:hypothetical protein
VQPRPDRLLPAAGAGPPRQHHENGLERILGVVAVAQHPLADAEHQPAVPANNPGKGLGIGGLGIAAQQLAVATGPGVALADQVANVSQDARQLSAGHDAILYRFPLTSLCRAELYRFPDSGNSSAVKCRAGQGGIFPRLPEPGNAGAAFENKARPGPEGVP